MVRIPFASVLLAVACAALAGCAGGGNPHFMPRTRPLFSELQEEKLGAAAKAMLGEAKEDFQLGRHGKDPRFAKYASTIQGTHSRVFAGRGYELTLVNKDMVVTHYVGPKIVLKVAITGGQPLEYDEVDSLGD